MYWVDPKGTLMLEGLTPFDFADNHLDGIEADFSLLDDEGNKVEYPSLDENK